MRTIKFRAWDGKEMFIDIIPLPNGNVAQMEDEEEIWAWAEKPKAIMQFTGLHDKNGKEIYGGDILSYTNKKGWKHDWLVFWSDKLQWGMKCFKGHDNSHTPQSLYNKAEAHEVIGNIYENPELLS